MKRWVRWALFATVAVELAVVAQRHAITHPNGWPFSWLHAKPAPPPSQGIEAVSLAEQPDRIADAAGVLGGFRHTIEWQTQAWRDDLGIEVHVVTLRAPREPIKALADRIFQERQIGEESPSGGLLILLNPARGEARIEVAYPLEHVFPDAVASRVAAGQLSPYAAYRVAGMAVMDVLHFLKDFAYLQAIRGEFALAKQFQSRPEYLAKARYLSGGAGASAAIAIAEQMDRDFKAIVPEAKRLSYAPARDPAESAEAYLRTLRDQVGDPTLDLYTPGSRCMLAAYPYAPFEQLERLVRMEDSKPLRVSVRGDRAVADSDRPAHGFVPILLERRQGLWRVDHVETWKNLFFDSNGDYRQHNSNHPYAFALSRFGDARLHGVAPYGLDPSDLVAAQRALAARGDALGEYLLGELLFRNCWLPVEALAHYERAIERSPHNLLFHETLGDRASYIGFHDLAVSAYAELGAYGLLPLARAQQAAGKVEEATATAREAVERDPYSIEALELLHWLLVASEDRAGAERVEQRLAKIRSDPDRPDAAVTIAFDPPYPVLHSDRPVRVGDTDVYDYSVFGLTLANPSAREIEVESVTLEADGTAGRSGRKDFKDYWKYPAGDHRLRPGESVSFNKSWGYDYEIDQHQIRYVFDVCWKGDGDRQCHAYWVDLLPAPVLLAGLADPVRADKTLVTAERIERVKDHSPRLAARLELLALLRAREFAELTRRVEAEQAAFERDPSLEPIAAQLWDTFATSDPTLQSVLEDWSESVASYAPRAALGVYHRRCGWAARGARLASKTSREQFDAMSEHFARSKQHLLRALEMHPQLVIAVQNLISSGRAGSDDAEMRRLVDRAMGICPSCVGPLASYLESLEPRWGGSHEQMERFLAELAPRMREHPRLAALRGTVAANRAFTASNREEYAAALRLYDEALGHGEHWPFRRYRGQVLYRLGRYDEALADHEAWLANGTRSAEALMWKAYTLGKLKRTAEAAESIALARLLDPGDDEIARLASRYDGSR